MNWNLKVLYYKAPHRLGRMCPKQQHPYMASRGITYVMTLLKDHFHVKVKFYKLVLICVFLIKSYLISKWIQSYKWSPRFHTWVTWWFTDEDHGLWSKSSVGFWVEMILSHIIVTHQWWYHPSIELSYRVSTVMSVLLVCALVGKVM